MTVYVDDFRVPARIAGVSGRWSHLTADTETELHEFAARIGLRREWFQDRCRVGRCEPCPHWHYDLADSKRREAIAAGAQSVSFREFGRIVGRRRAARACTCPTLHNHCDAPACSCSHVDEVGAS